MSKERDFDSRPAPGEEEGRDGDFARRRAKKKRPPPFVMETDFKFDYKNPSQLKHFVTDRGKIVPRRISGLTAAQQRALTLAIKRARQIALMPFTSND